jgi:hypothetical protein
MLLTIKHDRGNHGTELLTTLQITKNNTSES